MARKSTTLAGRTCNQTDKRQFLRL